MMHTDSTGKTLVDLAQTFGRRYRVTKEAGGSTWYTTPELDRPWLYEIAGKYGTVSPHGGELLQCSSGNSRVGARLLRLPFLLARRGGCRNGEECVIRFHVDHAAAVFALVRPRCRRQVTDAERERLVNMGEKARKEARIRHTEGVEIGAIRDAEQKCNQ